MSRPTARQHTAYVCSACGKESARWSGQCSACGQWETLKSFTVAPAAARANAGWTGVEEALPRQLSTSRETRDVPRYATGIGELDRTLGGGLVPGSVVLLGGDPGIGKSTLLLQAMAQLTHSGRRGLYVSGEESIDQIASRGRRLDVNLESVMALGASDIAATMRAIEAMPPDILVADSVQTLYDARIDASAGSVSQVKGVATILTRWAKQTGGCVLLVGHVTKDGGLAGPRVLEHLVDTVLQFEGDPLTTYRLLRVHKNRYGSVGELGVFEMTEEGLNSVDNPSAAFLGHGHGSQPGSCVFIQQEGPRPMLLDIQALLAPTEANAPRRLAIGLDGNRLAMMLAVLSQNANLNTGHHDVFVNAVGGLRVAEPAVDLAMIIAILSCHGRRALGEATAAFGEMGLTGELRAVPHAASRVREAARQGFRRILLPARGSDRIQADGVELIRLDGIWDSKLIALFEGH